MQTTCKITNEFPADLARWKATVAFGQETVCLEKWLLGEGGDPQLAAARRPLWGAERGGLSKRKLPVWSRSSCEQLPFWKEAIQETVLETCKRRNQLMRASWSKLWLVLKMFLEMHLRHLSENSDVLFLLCMDFLSWLPGNSFTSSAKFLKWLKI